MEVSCLMSSTLTLTLKQHSFKNPTNPNPVNTFYWHPFEFVHFFMHTHPTPPHSPSPPCPVSGHFALWCIWKCLLFCASYHDVICNKYLLFQLCSSWKVLSPWRGDILFFICTQPPLQLHPPPPPPRLPPSLTVSFWNVGLRYYLDPSDRVRLRPRVFLTPLYYYVTFTYALKTPTK